VIKVIRLKTTNVLFMPRRTYYNNLKINKGSYREVKVAEPKGKPNI